MSGSHVRVLIVGADAGATDRMRGTLAPRFACEVACSGPAALEAFSAGSFDVVVSSDALNGMSGFALLDTVRRESPDTAFILVGDLGQHASGATAFEAGRRGAYDYVIGPVDVRALLSVVERASADIDPRGSRAVPEPTIIGSSARLAETLDAAERVAQSTAPVLLAGETGTGKSLLAAHIHVRGPRRHQPLVVIHASSIPDTLLDSELFGHVAGAFTEGTRARKGLLAEAEGGTVLLDEIADLPAPLQGRLLRVLDNGLIRSVGADREHLIDVRFVATTRRDLLDSVCKGAFREDLYRRLNVLAIQVPPLRDRREDLPALIEYFFERARARNPRSPVKEIAPSAHERLLVSAWPGNVRELEGFVERLVVLGKGPCVERSDLDVLAELVETDVLPVPHKLCSLRDLTAQHIERVLASTGGDKTRAAAILGVDVSTLYRWQQRRLPDG